MLERINREILSVFRLPREALNFAQQGKTTVIYRYWRYTV